MSLLRRSSPLTCGSTSTDASSLRISASKVCMILSGVSGFQTLTQYCRGSSPRWPDRRLNKHSSSAQKPQEPFHPAF